MSKAGWGGCAGRSTLFDVDVESLGGGKRKSDNQGGRFYLFG